MGTRTQGITIALALLLSVAFAGPASAAWPGDNGRIVAVEPRYDWDNCPAEEGGHCDAPPPLGPMIVSQTPSGGDARDLAIGNDPSWDADGKKIVYVSTGYRIKKINADGTGRRTLTAPEAEPEDDQPIDTRPGWSPTGNRVVFQRTTAAGNTKKIMIMNLDGTPSERAITSGTLPEWSSRGRIAYIRRVDGVRRVHTIRPDGRERRVVPGTRGATDVTWAPGGRRLAFVTPGTDEAECVHVVRADGSRRKTLDCRFRGLDGGNIRGISWAPNGKSLLVGIHDAYSEPLYSEGRIVRVLLDGTKRQLDAVGYMPDWQPE